MTTERSKDSYEKLIYDFFDEVYVFCPSCNGQAIIKNPNTDKGINPSAGIKLICLKCGHNKKLDEKPDTVLLRTSRNTIKGKIMVIGGIVDPYFHLPLWFTMPCCNEILWAYNYNHIEFLRSHVEAKLRERNLTDIKNKSLGSRLPKWMTSKKNRASILKSLAILKEKK